MPDSNAWICQHCGSQNTMPFCPNCGIACHAPTASTADHNSLCAPQTGEHTDTGQAVAQEQPALYQGYPQTTPQPYYQQPYPQAGQQPYVLPGQQPYPQAGQQPYYQQPADQSHWQQPYPGQPYQQPMPTYFEQPQTNPQSSAAIPGWNTSILFSILGCLAGGTINGLLEVFSPTAGAWFTIVYCAITLYYCAQVYPSFFGDAPMFTNSNAISFANFLFGGIIFGCLWNHNITRGEKGISNVVYAVLAGLSLFVLFAAVAMM